MSDSPNKGMTVSELQAKLEQGELDTIIIAIPDMQGRLMGKRVTKQYFLEHAAEDGVHFCVYLLGTDMEMNTPSGFPGMSWERGYGDWVAKPDYSTARVLPWLEKTALVLADVVDGDGHLIEVAPRTVLRRQLARAAELGFRVQLASELEFYLIKETYESAFAKSYEGLQIAGHYNEDYNLLQSTRNEHLYRQFRNYLTGANIPIEGTKGEAGVGQHEINAFHADALETADRHVLLKQGVKEIAMQNGLSVTFMAKPDETWTGNSSHFHVSLWDADGNNTFADPAEFSTTLHRETAAAAHGSGGLSDADSVGMAPRDGTSGVGVSYANTEADAVGMSDVMRHFLAGLIHNIRDVSILFAPSVNSYKRYSKGSWAPTSIVWGVDNRTCGLRVVGRGKSKRIENRFPGADTNPYLAAAAMLAAGLDGIERKLPLPREWRGNGYEAEDAGAARLPHSLAEAIHAFANSEFAKEAFGDLVHTHYLNAAQVELDAYNQVVTNWEKKRYFERA